ncbi:leucine-rich_repeat domain-containing protein [Hexamita inflata]|uniref:Leucine-rich repeat domain-containing protein n=1 Tax=Hexamita inflata TaxID=28002 RepID=A0AA86NL18_9EUKA|nr:leucine-rich repeat domain-containing protein [Hexamita inflata]
MSVLMRRENTLIIEPGSDISKIQIINFILLPNSKKHFEGPPLQLNASSCNLQDLSVFLNINQQLSESKLQLLNLSYNSGISLNGLQQCKSLQNLEISNSELSNISIISQITSLVQLNMYSNQIKDISTIGKLLNLEQLNLSYNPEISSLEHLAPLLKIKKLDIDEIGAKTLNGIQNMTDLVYLRAWKNEFTHVNELETLTKLKEVNLSYNKISDLTGLRNAINIETLEVDGNELHNLEGLPRQSTKLISLSAYHNPNLKNIKCIGFYPNLEYICIVSCNLESLEGMNNLPKVLRVLIYFNELKSLKGIESCLYVKELLAECNKLESLDGIQQLKQMTNINVQNNKLTSIKEFEGLKQLEKININENQIKSFEGIENVESLQLLEAWSNKISSLYYLRNLGNLQFVNIDRNYLLDIRQLLFLRDLPQLKRIWLTENGQNKSANANKICIDPNYPNFIIQTLPQIVAYEYEVYFDRGPEYYDNTFSADVRNKAMGQVFDIPELTEELAKELKEQ